MAKLQQIIDEEIRKQARREINQQVRKLREQLAAVRKELAENKQQIKRLLSAANLPAVPPVGISPKPEDAGKPVRVTGARIKKWREKIGCSQSQYAALLGVNILSVCHWESGKTVPREEQKRKITALRDLKKRDLARLMAEKSIVVKQKRKRNPKKKAAAPKKQA